MAGAPLDRKPPRPTASPAELCDALYERHASHSTVRDERRHPRLPWVTTLTVWVKDRRNSWDAPRTLRVTTHDISRSGFSFVYGQFLHVDTVVCTQFDTLPGRPIITGIVANCVHVGGRQHRIGVRFVEADSSEE